MRQEQADIPQPLTAAPLGVLNVFMILFVFTMKKETQL